MVSFPDSFFRGNSGFQQYNQRFNRPNTAYFRGTYQVPGNNVICLYCQLPGHFARFCPYTNQQQRGRPATAPESTVTCDAENSKVEYCSDFSLLDVKSDFENANSVKNRLKHACKFWENVLNRLITF